MVSPYVIDYAGVFISPMIFLGIMSFLQTFLCFFLKETFEIKRDEQIPELKGQISENDECIKDTN